MPCSFLGSQRRGQCLHVHVVRCNSCALSSCSFYALERFDGEVIFLQALSVVFDLMLQLYFNVLLNKNELNMCMNLFFFFPL